MHTMITRVTLLVVLTFACSLTLADGTPSFNLSSPAFTNGQTIPRKFTCEGKGISPALHWQGVPAKARSIALIVEDPDAPDPAAPKITWIHWVLYDIPASASGLPENVTRAELPSGTQEGQNSWHKPGYGGPCPPIGRHRYFFRLFALDTVLDLPGGPTAQGLQAAMRGHIIAQTALLGTYRKSR